MRPLDIAVIAAYCAAVIVFGLVLSGRQRDASDYFLGHRGLPWWAIMLSIVATETSALTIISVPGLAARGDLTFLQLSFGYLVGRIGVAAFLLPGYFEGTQDTAYQRLERRFGTGARRTASGVFLVTRALADCVRIFATAIPLAIVTHWSLAAGILAIGIVTVSLSMTLTVKPSTDCAPTRAASTVADSCAPRWIEMQLSKSLASRLYTSANSPGEGADVVGSLVEVARRRKNSSLFMSTPSRKLCSPKRTFNGTTSMS